MTKLLLKSRCLPYDLEMLFSDSSSSTKLVVVCGNRFALPCLFVVIDKLVRLARRDTGQPVLWHF